MPDTQKIIAVLSDYKGDMESLNAFVAVAESEFGEDWVFQIQNALTNLPPELKGKFDHAYNYYSATVAWNEIQAYLNDEQLNVDDVEDRVPVLEYWLKFFGQSGRDVVAQLQQKLQMLKEGGGQSSFETSLDSVEMQPAAGTGEQTLSVSEPNVAEEMVSDLSEPEQNAEQQPASIQSHIDDMFPSEDVFEQPNDTSYLKEAEAAYQNDSLAVVEPEEVVEPVSAQSRIDEMFPSEDVFEQPNETSSLQESETPSENDSLTVVEPEMIAAPVSAPIEPQSVETQPVVEAAPVTPMVDETARFMRPTESVETMAPQSVVDTPVISETNEPMIEQTIVEEEIEPMSEQMPQQNEPVESPVLEQDIEPVIQPDVEPVVEQVIQPTVAPVAESAPEIVAEQIIPTIEPQPMASIPQASPVVQKTVVPKKDPALFLVDKIERQLDLLHQAQAWVSARCVSLGNIEPYKYTYYGFLMDMEQQILTDVRAVLSDETIMPILQQKYADKLQNLQSIETVMAADLEGAKGLFDSNPTPLVNQNLSADAAREALGALDMGGEKEYLGPAPDGFEMLEDPYETESGEFDEAKIKSDYEKIEDGAEVHLAQSDNRVAPVIRPNAQQSEKELANSPQKGVERKISVSLGVKPMRKKPTDAE